MKRYFTYPIRSGMVCANLDVVTYIDFDMKELHLSFAVLQTDYGVGLIEAINITELPVYFAREYSFWIRNHNAVKRLESKLKMIAENCGIDSTQSMNTIITKLGEHEIIKDWDDISKWIPTASMLSEDKKLRKFVKVIGYAIIENATLCRRSFSLQEIVLTAIKQLEKNRWPQWRKALHQITGFGWYENLGGKYETPLKVKP